MILSNPLPGATTRPPDTQQLPPSQPIIQQPQASTETMAPALSSEHPSSLPSPSALSCSQDTVILKALFLFPVPITIATLPGAGVTIGHLLQVPLLRRPLHGLQVLSGGAPVCELLPGEKGKLC
ncbi:hypothetical protein EMCRGX_G029069 [Ephydatia muelleri]